MKPLESAISRTAYRLASESYFGLRAEVAAFAKEAQGRGLSHAEIIALVVAYQQPHRVVRSPDNGGAK